MGIRSAYSEYINWETMKPIIFFVCKQINLGIIVCLKYASYCPFYMHITSIIVFYMLQPHVYMPKELIVLSVA